VLTVKARRNRLDAAIATMAADSEFTPMVRRLGSLRGIGTLTGFALAVELRDWHRFTGDTIGSFVGLVPSEFSSDSSRAQAPITKTGNTHVRRLLVEAAWHHRARYVGGTPCVSAGSWPAPRHELAVTRATAACTPVGTPSGHAASGRDRQRRHRP